MQLEDSRPSGREPQSWWRRGDSRSAAFVAAWTMPSSWLAWGKSGCGACYPARCFSRILVPTQWPQGHTASLWVSTGQAWSWPSSYPSALPCGSSPRRFHRCELRYQPALSSRRDPWSNPRPQAL